MLVRTTVETLAMNNPAKTLDIFAQGELEVVMKRTFSAPRPLVFTAWTTPAYLKKWLLGPPGWVMTVCDVDLRVGGSYRYVWYNERKGEMGMGGVYREVQAPERLVATECFDQPWYSGEAVSTAVFIEQNGQTVVTSTMRYASAEARDGILASNMESGVAASYDRLEALLVDMPV